MNITMAEIARLAGVSRPTVSKILNNKEALVTPATREKVLKIIRELNYYPDHSARSLRSGKRYSIGVCGSAGLDEMADIAISRTYAGIGAVADRHRNHLSFFPMGGEVFEDSLIPICNSRMVDGLIIFVYSLFFQKFIDSTLPILHRGKIPVCAIHYSTRPLPCHNIGYDALKAGYLATCHLIENQYRRIAVITTQSTFGQDFYQGYQDAMEAARLPFERYYIKGMEYTAQDGYRKGKQFLKEYGISDGYVVFTDTFAYGFIRALAEAGKKVPEDVGVVGFDNLIKDTVLPPTLTTVDRKFEEHGRRAAEVLFKQINGELSPDRDYTKTVIEPELVVRASTRLHS